jgi:tRNA nucleotidyltransferase (CCA-adding enzyme)
MNRPSLDYDLVVEGDAVILGKSLAKQFGGRIVSHRRFGTAKWWINEIRTQLAKTLDDNGSLLPDDFPESIDLISARTEYYDHPTALPSVERSSIKLDLHRRDFTINTLALRLDGNHYGELYDHWGGLNDLRHGLVRVLHSLSFVDDPTRMLRAVRFEQRFKFRIETRTLQLMDEARTILHHVSGQRLQHEINLILMEEKSGEIFSRMKELGLLSSIQPELDWLVDDTTIFTTILNKQPDPEWNLPGTYSMFSYRQFLGYLIWLSRFPLDKLKEICTKLRLPTKLIKSLLGANSLWNEAFSLVDQPPSKIVSYLEKIPLIAIYAIYLTYPASEVRLMLDKYSREWRNMRPSINGQILRERNIAPGRIYQNILDRIRAAWLDGEIKSIEEENHLLGKLLKDFSDISNYGN